MKFDRHLGSYHTLSLACDQGAKQYAVCDQMCPSCCILKADLHNLIDSWPAFRRYTKQCHAINPKCTYSSLVSMVLVDIFLVFIHTWKKKEIVHQKKLINITTRRFFTTKFVKINCQPHISILQLISCKFRAIVTLCEHSCEINTFRSLLSLVGYTLKVQLLECCIVHGVSEKSHLFTYRYLLVVLMRVYGQLGCCKEVRPRPPLMIDSLYTGMLHNPCKHVIETRKWRTIGRVLDGHLWHHRDDQFTPGYPFTQWLSNWLCHIVKHVQVTWNQCRNAAQLTERAKHFPPPTRCVGLHLMLLQYLRPVQ